MKATFQKPQSWAVLMVALAIPFLFFSAHFPDKRAEKPVVNRQKVPEHLVLVEGGTFEMGDCFGESRNDETVHTVSVRSFLLAKHELSGNVWEWCWDWFEERYSMGSLTDPKGPESGNKHLVRGGSRFNFAENARAANRYAFSQGLREYEIGFRLARNY